VFFLLVLGIGSRPAGCCIISGAQRRSPRRGRPGRSGPVAAAKKSPRQGESARRG